MKATIKTVEKTYPPLWALGGVRPDAIGLKLEIYVPFKDLSEEDITRLGRMAIENIREVNISV